MDSMALHSPAPIKKAIARLRHSNGTVVGAGFLVTNSCLLTCAHVVTEVLGLPQNHLDALTEKVELEFVFSDDPTPLKAQVVFWRSVNPGRKGEDIAGLKIETAIPTDIQAVKMEKTDDWWNHPFSTYGFPKGHDPGVWALGRLIEERGLVGWVQMEAITVNGQPIQPGFSGSPIWDNCRGEVVGMAIAEDRKRETKTAFMIPTKILSDALEALSLIEILSPIYPE